MKIIKIIVNEHFWYNNEKMSCIILNIGGSEKEYPIDKKTTLNNILSSISVIYVSICIIDRQRNMI